MKKLLRISTALSLCSVLGIAGLGAPAFAEPAGAASTGKMDGKMGGPGGGRMQRGGRMGGGRMGEMAKTLNLTDAQKIKMKAIMEAQRPKMMALRNGKSLTEEQKRAKRRGLQMDQMKQMNAILTPEQRQKMAAMRKARRDARPDRAPKIVK